MIGLTAHTAAAGAAGPSAERADELHCRLGASFALRMLIVIIAGAIFLLYTYVRRKLGLERRSFRTFAADTVKVGAQLVLGGVCLALMGGWLSHKGLDSLSWYGAEYPFEVVMSTYLTKVMKDVTTRARLSDDTLGAGAAGEAGDGGEKKSLKSAKSKSMAQAKEEQAARLAAVRRAHPHPHPHPNPNPYS